MSLAPAAAPRPRATLDGLLATAFLENAPDLVYFKDRDSRFIAASRSKLRRHALQREDELIGKTDANFFSAQHARAAREDELAVMTTGLPILGKLEKPTWPDGRESWALTSKMPLRDETGVIVGTFGITQDVTAAKQMEFALESTRQELIDASCRIGMAEVATGVLHNVRNVLNSLNVSADVLTAGLRQSKIDSLEKTAALLQEHAAAPGEFLTRDPKGRLVPGFLVSLARHSATERDRLLQEVRLMQENLNHIEEIVATQQGYATTTAIVEPLDAATLVDDALRMNTGTLARHAIAVVRDFQPVPPLLAERAKVLQILINLVRNAKHALATGNPPVKTLTLRLAPGAPGRVRVSVSDNGVGIAAKSLSRLFSLGFTTRDDGHGIGLHCSLRVAREMKGTLVAHSDGPGTGATFTLELPAAPADVPPANLPSNRTSPAHW